MAAPALKIISPADVSVELIDPVVPSARVQAEAIMKDVQDNGFEGLARQATKLGDIKEGGKLIVGKPELKSAYDSLPADEQALLQRVGDRIRIFAEAQRASVKDMTCPIAGGQAGHQVVPMEVAGCYAPGGRYPLPSSVLMTALTARAAGVRTVWVASPRPTTVTLAAAHVAGADAVLAAGGAQAVAALAYGVGDVPACDIIVGPGNRWVTAAKSLVAGRCAIDMLAGPSECLCLCDSTADPAVVAHDLLAQAEHDTDAMPILVTTDATLPARVNAEIAAQLETLPTAETARVSVAKGIAVACGSMDEAIAVTDRFAPEHLEVQTADSQAVADRVGHYGGLFIGPRAAEVFGDYGAGPNHVLPTGGTARYTGGLSVFSFLRVRTWMRVDDAEASQVQVVDAACLARLEGLEGHARAAEARKLGKDSASAAAGEPARRAAAAVIAVMAALTVLR
eukprot:g1866.t1